MEQDCIMFAIDKPRYSLKPMKLLTGSLFFISVLIMPTLLGCDYASPKVQEMQDSIGIMQSRIAALESNVASLQADLSFLRMDQRFKEVAYLTPGSDGYSIIESDIGRLTVSLENVQSYANGSKITLNFGNISNATINGASATIEWGNVNEYGTPNNASAKSKEITFKKSLTKGAWTRVPIVLDGVPSSQLGFVRVREMRHTGIVLYN